MARVLNDQRECLMHTFLIFSLPILYILINQEFSVTLRGER
jgi:hypothetical protein